MFRSFRALSTPRPSRSCAWRACRSTRRCRPRSSCSRGMHREVTPASSFIFSSHSRSPHPHGLGEAALGLHEGLDLLQGVAHLGVVLQGSAWPADRGPSWTASTQLLDLGLQLVQGDKDLLPGVPAADAATGSSPCPWGRSPRAGARPSSHTGRPSSPWTGRSRPCPPRMPAAFRRSRRAEAASSTPSLCWATGITMAWMGAMRGGSTRPVVVAVGHDDAADHAGGHAPRKSGGGGGAGCPCR